MSVDSRISRSRLIYTALLSASAHIVLLAGIGFSFSRPQPGPIAPQLEVILASQQSAQAPQQADFLAAVQQQGDGDQALSLSVPAPGAETQPSLQPPLEGNARIASLRESVERQRQDYASLPRRQVLSAAATLNSNDAAYLLQWRQQVESIGNQYYPQLAAAQGLDGSLRMLVAVRADGSVEQVSILQSSGQRILDETARRIVAMAAPFAPFPDSLRQEADILEIIRTWRFQSGTAASAAVGLTP
jgi:protein TonB